MTSCTVIFSFALPTISELSTTNMRKNTNSHLKFSNNTFIFFKSKNCTQYNTQQQQRNNYLICAAIGATNDSITAWIEKPYQQVKSISLHYPKLNLFHAQNIININDPKKHMISYWNWNIVTLPTHIT